MEPATVECSLAHALVAPQTIDRQSDCLWKSSPASPEEGFRLIHAFLRIEREEDREETIKFVEEKLRVQDASQHQAP
jgi:hypothetical protein